MYLYDSVRGETDNCNVWYVSRTLTCGGWECQRPVYLFSVVVCVFSWQFRYSWVLILWRDKSMCYGWPIFYSGKGCWVWMLWPIFICTMISIFVLLVGGTSRPRSVGDVCSTSHIVRGGWGTRWCVGQLVYWRPHFPRELGRGIAVCVTLPLVLLQSLFPDNIGYARRPSPQVRRVAPFLCHW